jgi:hypothetical protein
MTPQRHNELHDALRRAFRQVDPPPGFAERVLQRTSQGAVPKSIGRGAWLRWATAAALAITASGGLWYRAEERRRTQGEEARRQVLLSLQITGSRLREVQMKINRQQESRP